MLKDAVLGDRIPGVVLGDLGKKGDWRVELYFQSEGVRCRGTEIDQLPEILPAFCKFQIFLNQGFAYFLTYVFGPFEQPWI